MKKRKVLIGDVFIIPLSDGRMVYGQVVAECSPRCYLIFNEIYSQRVADISIFSSSRNILFLTFTFDECLEKGIWPVVGNVQPNNTIKMPVYKVETLECVYVTDYAGEYLHKATNDEAENLEFRSFMTPYTLEMLVQFHFGYIPGITKYAREVYDNILYT